MVGNFKLQTKITHEEVIEERVIVLHMPLFDNGELIPRRGPAQRNLSHFLLVTILSTRCEVRDIGDAGVVRCVLGQHNPYRTTDAGLMTD